MQVDDCLGVSVSSQDGDRTRTGRIMVFTVPLLIYPLCGSLHPTRSADDAGAAIDISDTTTDVDDDARFRTIACGSEDAVVVASIPVLNEIGLGFLPLP